MSISNDQLDTSRPTKSQYMSKKDLSRIAAIGVILFIIGIPVFKNMKENRDKQACAANLKGIYSSMMQYAAQHDDRLPPIYEVGANGSPLLEGGKPYVWASILSPYMDSRTDFDCPTAAEEEVMATVGSDGHENIDIGLTYGMYEAMSAMQYKHLSKPNNTVLIGETSNFGSGDSFNPVHFNNGKADVPFDAFMIGYDDSNFGFTDKSQWVTRLAMSGVSNGYGSESASTRHKDGIHVIFIGGNIGMIQPQDANINNVYPDLEGIWRSR